MFRGLTIFFLASALFAMGVRLYIRAGSLPSWQSLGQVAEQEISTGGLQALLRGRIAAVSVQAALSRDSDAAAMVAFVNALLASDYGLDSIGAALAAADSVVRDSRASARARSLQLTSRALVNIARGDFLGAEKQALEAVAIDHEPPAPVFALGRARYRQGNLEGAMRAFQAALLRDPDFTEARVAFAEVMLDGGQPALAKKNLLSALQKCPDHLRAQLVLFEVPMALAVEKDKEQTNSCKPDGQGSPFLASFCDLVRAEQAWQLDDKQVVITFATAVEKHRPMDPRLVGRAAQLLASLGMVDQANRLTVEATRFASSRFPAIRWAQTAIDLGRGRLVEMPPQLALSSSLVAPSLEARVSLASGGIDALSAAMVSLHENHFTQDPVLDSFATFLRDRKSTPPDGVTPDPLKAYVMGLYARLSGDLSLSFRLLAGALYGHGDACRAAGEYLAVGRILMQPPASDAFDFLKSQNTGCVNLAAALTAFKPHAPKSRK